MDPLFRVEVVSATPNPQQVIYAAMHQDYSEAFVSDERDRWPDESSAGEAIVKNLLKGDRGHYGPLEHPQIVLNAGWFPHSTMQQVRTHRVGISFDCQSFRYTGDLIKRLGDGFREAFERGLAYQYRSTIEGFEYLMTDCADVFYLRPVGAYCDRKGQKYVYTELQRNKDLKRCLDAAKYYSDRIDEGFSEEHARGLIPFDVRQHWVMSANVRSLMHLLDLRWKADAQLECQQLCDLIWPHFQAWVPAIAQWYKETRAKKARLAP